MPANTATFQIILFPKPTKDGRRGVYARTTYLRQSRYMSLKRFCDADQWNADAGRFRKNYADHKKENEVLAAYESRAAEILRGYERDAKTFTFDRFFADLFSDGATGGGVLLRSYTMEVADDLKKSGHFGNSVFYRSLAAAIGTFKAKAVLNDVTGDWLAKFETHCRTVRGMTDGGIKVNMRTLRAICNRAIKCGHVPASWYPFNKYTPAHLNKPTTKRAISIEDMRKFEAFQTDNPFLRMSVDLFLFSFYARGMNMADIAELKGENIKGDRIEYRRKKTGTLYSVPLTEKMADILARSAGHGVHLFPILPDKHSDDERYRAMNRATANTNVGIKEVARLLGVPDDMVFYTARHTYATALKRKGVSVEKISEALGHGDIATTQIYLASFDQSEIDEMDKLLE